MNILITGAKGQLGSSLQQIPPHNGDIYFFTDVDDLDITRRNDVLEWVIDKKIDVIVNCAAYTNVDMAESQPDAANLINNLAVENLALAAAQASATLIHISTDYVFGGNVHNTPCNELVEVHPTSVYGATKLAGEQAVIRSGAPYIIIRTAWLYSPYGKNFLKTMLKLTAERSQLNVVFDQVGTPTYAAHLAAAIRHIIDSRLFHNTGLYHFSNQGVCSWFDFAHAIARLAGHNQCNITPCHSSEFPSPVVRPAFSVLDKTKFISTFNYNIPHWFDALKECISTATLCDGHDK